jgi:formylmethanofuran dehydrogenase subunit E
VNQQYINHKTKGIEIMYTGILNDMERLLEAYEYEYSYKALQTIIDEWSENKAPLLEAFQKHPNYIPEQYCIAFDTDYHREIDVNQSRNFSRYLEIIIPEFTNNIPTEHTTKYQSWERTCNIADALWYFLTSLERRAYRTLSEEDFIMLDKHMPEIHPHAGEKMSRVVNRICTYFGYNTDSNYNKEFAKYADSLSPLTIKRHTILSLNPLDYLTMSFGNSWASCHTIDKHNRRNMPNSYAGQYSSGTMSYMLDPSSMVFYTVDKSYDGTEYWSQPKITRQMFHYGEDKLVQGRLYPQKNDGNSDEYAAYRHIVQQVIAECFGVPNLWNVSKGISNVCDYIISKGTHYPDYSNFDSCNISTNKSMPNENRFVIGHDPICIKCGCEHDISENINCCRGSYIECYDCGREIDPDDAHYINGNYYCDGCVHYCGSCDEYHVDDEYYIEDDDMWVCQTCYDNYYNTCDNCYRHFNSDNMINAFDANGYNITICEECFEEYYEECANCGQVHRRSRMTEIEDDEWVCPSCFEKYAECSQCGEYYLKSNMTQRQDEYICADCLEDIADAV